MSRASRLHDLYFVVQVVDELGVLVGGDWEEGSDDWELGACHVAFIKEFGAVRDTPWLTEVTFFFGV